MPYRTSAVPCVTRLIPLRRLNATRQAQCEALRKEAGRCWSDLVTLHREARMRGEWPSARDMELFVANRYALHSQTLQGLAQRLDANLQTARELRKQEIAAGGETIHARLPYRTPEYQTVVWKDMAIRVIGKQLYLSNGRGRAALILTLLDEYRATPIARAELLWRADHYILCLTLDDPAVGVSSAPVAPVMDGAGSDVCDVVAGVDLGEIHIAAVVTTSGEALIVSGRRLRSQKRLRNKRHGAYQSRLAHCVKGSRRWRRLRRRKAQASAIFYRQQRDTLHQASRRVVRFCQREGVAQIAVGDVRNIQDGVYLGSGLNQKIAQWAHGQFYSYLAYKAARMDMRASYISESYSSKTCSACGIAHSRQVRGRTFICTACGVRQHRDVNGAANICSRSVTGAYGHVQAQRITHLRPVGNACYYP